MTRAPSTWPPFVPEEPKETPLQAPALDVPSVTSRGRVLQCHVFSVWKARGQGRAGDWGWGRWALTGPAGPAGRAARSAQRSSGQEKASTCSCAGRGVAPPPSASAPGIRAGSPGPAGQTAVPTAAAISPSPPTGVLATPARQHAPAGRPPLPA